MSHTNTTPNYGLPQFITTDKPFWLTDINTAFSDIDTGINTAKTTADTASTNASQALLDASAASTAAASANAKGDGAIASIANAFDTTATYLLNDLVMYNSLLYKCTTAVTTPGPWTGSTNWTRITVESLTGEVITGLNAEIATKEPSANLDGFKFKYEVLENNVDVYSPAYNDICIAIIGRTRAAAYIGSNSDVMAIVPATGISIYKIGSQIRVTNVGGSTSICCFIYR